MVTFRRHSKRNQIGRGFARMDADQTNDQDKPTHLISSFFKSAFIRENPRLVRSWPALCTWLVLVC